METTRQKKISRLVLKELAEILRLLGPELAPGRLITVTTVRISPDLSVAKSYISVFPSADTDDVIKKITDATGRIRYTLGQKVRSQLRIVPELVFYPDDSIDYIENIDSLLKPKE